MAQPFFAPDSTVRESFDALFDAGWYTNNGPRLQLFERVLAEAVGVPHAVCVCSPESALALTVWGLDADAREVRCGPGVGSTLVTALTGFGCRVRTADGPAHSPRAVDLDVPGGPLARNRSGGDRALLLDLTAEGSLVSIGDALRSGGVTGAVGAFREGGDVVLPEGGVLYTAQSAVADLLRTARNHHPGETFAPVPVRFNAKMSEGQATFGLLCLERRSRAGRGGNRD